MKTNRGFTIIETLVYLGLFAILFGGAIVAAYNLFQGNSRGQTKIMMQEEGDFIVGKINWALSGAESVETPAINATSNTLSLTKWDTTLNPILISLDTSPTGNVTLSKSGNPAITLNNTNTSISNLNFTQIYAGGTNPESVLFSFTLTAKTLDGMLITQDFSSEKFIKK